MSEPQPGRPRTSPASPLSPDERGQALAFLARIEDQLASASESLYSRSETKSALLLAEAASEVAAAAWALVRSGQPALAGQAPLARPKLAASPDGSGQGG